MAQTTGIPISYRLENGETGSFTLRDQLVVGSSTQADVTINTSYISRQHLRLEQHEGQVYVTDLNSRNGTFLDGQRLPANDSYVWSSGSRLHIGQIEFLLGVKSASRPQPAQAIPTTGSKLFLESDQSVLWLQRSMTLRAMHTLPDRQLLTFEALHDVDGLQVAVTPPDLELEGNIFGEVTIRASRQRPMLSGGKFPVRLIARSNQGDYDGIDITVRARSRYPLLFILLLLPICALMLLIFANDSNPLPEELVIASTETLSPTASETPTSTITPSPSETDTSTGTPSATLSPTATRTGTATASPTASRTATLTRTATVTHTSTPTATRTATATATPTPCTPCAARGWPLYTIQGGDTLFGLSIAGGVPLASLAQENCIADTNAIFAGQTICLPATRTPPPTAPDLSLTQLTINPARSEWDATCTRFTLGFAAAVQNIGDTVSEATDLRLSVERNTAQWITLNVETIRSVSALDAGLSQAFDGTLDLLMETTNVAAADRLRLNGEVGGMDMIDSDLTNNSRNSSPFTVPDCVEAQPDLSIVQLSLSLGEWDADCSSYQFPYSVSVENLGTLSSPAISIRIDLRYLDSDTFMSAVDTLALAPLVPGGIDTLNSAVSISDPDTDREIRLEAVLFDPAQGPNTVFDDANMVNNSAASASASVPTCVIETPEVTEEPEPTEEPAVTAEVTPEL